MKVAHLAAAGPYTLGSWNHRHSWGEQCAAGVHTRPCWGRGRGNISDVYVSKYINDFLTIRSRRQKNYLISLLISISTRPPVSPYPCSPTWNYNSLPLRGRLKFPLKGGLQRNIGVLLSPPLPYQKYHKRMQTWAPLQIFMTFFFPCLNYRRTDWIFKATYMVQAEQFVCGRHTARILWYLRGFIPF